MDIWPAYAPFVQALEDFTDVTHAFAKEKEAFCFFFSYNGYQAPAWEETVKRTTHTSHQILEAIHMQNLVRETHARAQEAFQAIPQVQALHLTMRILMVVPDELSEMAHGTIAFSRGPNVCTTSKYVSFAQHHHLAKEAHFNHLAAAQEGIKPLLKALLDMPLTPDDPLWTYHVGDHHAFLVPFHAPDYATANAFVQMHSPHPEASNHLLPIPVEGREKFWNTPRMIAF